MSYVNMNMKSTSDWSSTAKIKEFADILISEGGFLMPEKLDSREPERFKFNPEDLTKLIELWTSSVKFVLLTRKKPYYTCMMIMMVYQESKRFNDIISSFDERYFEDEANVAKLLSCAKRIYNWGSMAHGYLCYDKDWDRKNSFGKPTEVIHGRLAASGGGWLEWELPGIYWANFFGPVYVDFFGREKFLTVPAYHKEELPDGGFLILTAPTPLEYGSWKLRSLEKKIIKHLGRDAFFEKKYPKKICRAPEFTFEQEALGRPIEVVAYDPLHKVIFDVKRFVEEVPQLAEALREHFPKALDYSMESLDKIDDFILKKSYRRPEPWDKEKGRRLIQELTAYYGEVLRKNLKGKWELRQPSGSTLRPAIVFPSETLQECVEYPLRQVVKLWCERERIEGLANRHRVIQRN